MSAPTTRLLSDARAAEIEAMTTRALSRQGELSDIASEFALAAYALLKDREARCELLALARPTPETEAQ